MIFLNNAKVRYRVLLTILLIFGIYLRIAQLSNRPLNELEAKTALQSLNYANGTPDFSITQPLYIVVTSLFFQLFGTGNLVARLFSAMCGFLILFFPFLYHRKIQLAKLTFLVAFIALDTILITWSTQADGLIPFLALSLYGLYFLSIDKKISGIILVGLSIALGLRAFPFVIAIFIAMPILAVLDVLWFSTGIRPMNVLSQKMNRYQWFMLIAVIVLGATGFFAFPSGLNGLGNAFLSTFTADALDKQYFRLNFFPMLMAFLLYLSIPFILTVVAIRAGMKKSDYQALIAFIGILIMAGLLWFLGQGVLTLAYLILPLLVLASDCALLTNNRNPLKLHQIQTIAASLIPFLGFFLLQRLAEIIQLQDLSLPLTIRWQDTMYSLPFNRFTSYTLIIAIGIIVVVVLIPTILRSFDRKQTRIGLIFGLLVVTVLSMVHNSWNAAGLNPGGDFRQNNTVPEQHSLLLGRIKFPVSSELVPIVDEISLKSVGFTNRLKGANLVRNDVMLDWILREYPNVTKRALVSKTGNNLDLLISDPAAEMPVSGGYVGMVIDWSSSINWDQFTTQDWLSWLLYKNQYETRSQVIIWQPTKLVTSNITGGNQ